MKTGLLSIKSSAEEAMRQLSTQISKRSGVSGSEVYAVIESFIDLIPERIMDGKIVRLGEFGSFSISLSSEGVDKAEDFTATNIKGNSLNFRPGKIFQKALDAADYKKVSE